MGARGNKASMGANFRDYQMESITDGIVGMCLGVVALTGKEMVTKFIKGFGASAGGSGTRVDKEAEFVTEHEAEVRRRESLIMTLA